MSTFLPTGHAHAITGLPPFFLGKSGRFYALVPSAIDHLPRGVVAYACPEAYNDRWPRPEPVEPAEAREDFAEKMEVDMETLMVRLCPANQQ